MSSPQQQTDSAAAAIAPEPRPGATVEARTVRAACMRAIERIDHDDVAAEVAWDLVLDVGTVARNGGPK